MITVRTTIPDAVRYFESLAAEVDSAIDMAIEESLNGLMARMVPVTPIVTGRMKANYGVEAGAGLVGYLMDTQFYAGWIAYEGIPHRITRTPNQALKSLLDDFMGAGGEADLEAAMESALRTKGFI